MKLKFESYVDCDVETAFLYCASKSGFEDQFPHRIIWKNIPRDIFEVGDRLDFYMSIYGMKINYIATITELESGKRFVDIMNKGPYGEFTHEHDFFSVGKRTRIVDTLTFTPMVPKYLGGGVSKVITQNIFTKRHNNIRRKFNL